MNRVKNRVKNRRFTTIKLSFLLSIVMLLCSMPSGVQADDESPAGKKAVADQVDSSADRIKNREEKFTQQMEKTVLVGFFTLDRDQPGRPGKPERYEISKVTKAEGNKWVFQTRVKYGKVDIVLPILVPIEWAGDTPVVSMTDFAIPGMGTFTCRVMFHDDRYAGTWQHGEKGGHMWGKIEKVKK